MGDAGLAEALRSGAIELEGTRELIRSFPKWFGLHPLSAGVDHHPEPAENHGIALRLRTLTRRSGPLEYHQAPCTRTPPGSHRKRG